MVRDLRIATASFALRMIQTGVAPRFEERFRGPEDVEWWLRLAQQHRVTTVPDVGYLVRSHGGPRHGNGPEARVEGLDLLLDRYTTYFDAHRRARAFSEEADRAGETAPREGPARAAFRNSLRAGPEARTA